MMLGSVAFATEQHPREQGLKHRALSPIHGETVVATEQHPREQGLKLSIRASRGVGRDSRH